MQKCAKICKNSQICPKMCKIRFRGKIDQPGRAGLAWTGPGPPAGPDFWTFYSFLQIFAHFCTFSAYCLHILTHFCTFSSHFFTFYGDF